MLEEFKLEAKYYAIESTGRGVCFCIGPENCKDETCPLVEQYREKQKENLKPFGYAEGGYICRCHICKEQFIGDKRAITCKQCALENIK